MLNNFLYLIRFDKPIGTLLLLWPTLGALFVAAHGIPPYYTLIVFTLGVFLTRSAGCAINDVADAEFDKHVARTQNRPLAKGYITKKQALCISLGLSLIAFIMAGIWLHQNTLYMSIPALFIFITYPFIKRFFPLPQAYLGVAYSFGILMAFIEVSGHLDILAVLLFIANFLWVFAYDTIYAMVDKADDLKIGIKTSAITLGHHAVTVIAVCYIVYGIIFVAIGIMLHLNLLYYPALICSLAILVYQVIVLSRHQEARYFKLFLLNNYVGLLTLIGVAVGLQ